MNPPLPASLRRAESEARDLDTRIQLVEQRLIAREENLRRGVAALGQRVRDAMQLRQLALPVIGAAVAAYGVWRLWRDRHRAHLAHLAARGSARRVPGARASGATSAPPTLPWLRTAALVWPALPLAWRARVNRAIVNLVMVVGLPLTERLLAWRRGRLMR